jgi:hypothetical protein
MILKSHLMAGLDFKVNLRQKLGMFKLLLKNPTQKSEPQSEPTFPPGLQKIT